MARERSRDPASGALGRQIALGFASVSAIAVVMCASLLAVVVDVSNLVGHMRHQELSIRQGLSLAAAVRELSLDVAQVALDGDASRAAAYETSRARVRALIQELAAELAPEHSTRLEALARDTQRVHETFESTLLPRVRRGELLEARRAYAELARDLERAAGAADALAQVTTSEMARSHVRATDSTRLGIWVAGACVVLVLALSLGFTLRLRQVVLRPLGELTRAARRFGAGHFDLRVGHVGRGELAALGTALDRMADELAHREKQLLESERMAAIGQLAAGVAHELNNPIGIIRGYLDTMNPQADPATLREELAIVDEEVGHCQRIAEDLVTYSRGGGELSPSRIAMEPFLWEAARRFSESAQASGRGVDVDAQEHDVEADATRLRQVVLNLLSNAVQASPPGSEINLRGRVEGEGYRIDVVDRGPGVEASERERIFEPFVSRRKGGSGLGLAVCQGIARAHGGRIWVSESEGGLTVFSLWIPLQRATGDDREVAS